MDSPRRPWWRQATALVSLSAGGAITGFAFVPGTADAVASPAGLPVTLTALDHAARPAPSDDSAVRSAIVSVTNYYLRLAQSKTPAEMEALIWQRDSTDAADHGESCAAFAGMTLALAAQMVGRQSWVTGGSSYPWPLQDWADVRVDPNPASPGITSILQDAQAHQRWHPLGDGYQPLPGDWVLFDGHVEVVTKYAGGVLSTVGGDSLPNFSVNAHEYPGLLSAQDVAGFVSNGNLPAAVGSAAVSSPSSAPAGAGTAAAAQSGAATAAGGTGTASRSGSSAPPATQQADEQPAGALAAVPGTVAAASGSASASASAAAVQAEQAVIPGVPQPGPTASGRAPSAGRAPSHRAASPVAAHRAAGSRARNDQPAGQAGPGPVTVAGTVAGVSAQAADQPASFNASPDVVIPGMPDTTATGGAGYSPATTSTRQQPAPAAAAGSQQPAPAAAAGPGTPAQQAFIAQVAPGAIAAQRTYGVPAAVTIAQAIDESGWGQSTLAVQASNLFGIKGTGPAGSDSLPTQEFENGQWVTTTAQFRAYHEPAQSIEDHGQLLATSGYYTAAMAERRAPDRFAQALTGVYATNPDYGSNLISLMQHFDLYRFGASTQPAAPARAPRGTTTPQAAAYASPAGTAPAAPPVAPSPPRARTAAPGRTVRPPAARPGPAAPSTTVTTPVAAPTTTVSPPAAKASATATAPGPATPHAAGSPHAMATAPAAPAPGQPAGLAATPPSSPVPHPFATPQAAPSAAAALPDQAAIPGVPSGPAPTSTHTSAQLRTSAAASRPRSSADTEVVAEVAAVFRHETPAQKPLPDRAPDSRRADRKPPAGASPAKRAPVDRSAQKKPGKRKGPAAAKARKTAPRYQPQMPTPVKNAFLASARKPLARAEFLYRDVAGTCGISWKLLAVCDWMQCEAHPRYSPVQGEKLGTVNRDGTVFRTKSEALTQCARELVAVADTVYQIDLTVPVELSVLELARVFAAFRWGGLLKLHNTSAMEFPYSVQGLTEQHSSMRWPKIADPNAPDKPGARYRRPFGAVPVVLSLEYPATV